MKISKKLSLFLLCMISVCNIFAMENTSKVDPEIMQYYINELHPNDSEQIINISCNESGTSILEDGKIIKGTYDFVTIAKKSNYNIITREHCYINKKFLKSFVYVDDAPFGRNENNQSEVIKKLFIENYWQKLKLSKAQKKNKKLNADLEKLKNSSLNSLIWTAGGALIIGFLIGGAIAYYNQSALHQYK